jgi:hypothetical protein
MGLPPYQLHALFSTSCFSERSIVQAHLVSVCASNMGNNQTRRFDCAGHGEAGSDAQFYGTLGFAQGNRCEPASGYADVAAGGEGFISCGVFGKLKTQQMLAKQSNIAKFCQTT